MTWGHLPELTRESIVAMLHLTCHSKRKKYRHFAATTIVGYTNMSFKAAEELVGMIAEDVFSFVSEDKFAEMQKNWLDAHR